MQVKTLREWPVKIEAGKGLSVRSLGLHIFFNPDQAKVLFPLLKEGRMTLVASARVASFSDRSDFDDAIPVFSYSKAKRISLENELTSRNQSGQEHYFLAEGRYLKWLPELTMFGRSYFLGEGDPAAKWSLSLVTDYYSLMYKAISLLNNSSGFENKRSSSCGAKQRDALAVAAAAVLVELEHQPPVDDYYSRVLTRKVAALSATLTFDQKVQLVGAEENLLARLWPTWPIPLPEISGEKGRRIKI